MPLHYRKLESGEVVEKHDVVLREAATFADIGDVAYRPLYRPLHVGEFLREKDECNQRIITNIGDRVKMEGIFRRPLTELEAALEIVLSAVGPHNMVSIEALASHEGSKLAGELHACLHHIVEGDLAVTCGQLAGENAALRAKLNSIKNIL